MNQLKMDIQQTISTLSRRGWSQRRIARELGIDRETVARYRRLARQVAEPKPAISPAGSEPSSKDQTSHCAPRPGGDDKGPPEAIRPGRAVKTSHFARRVQARPSESLRAF